MSKKDKWIEEKNGEPIKIIRTKKFRGFQQVPLWKKEKTKAVHIKTDENDNPIIHGTHYDVYDSEGQHVHESINISDIGKFNVASGDTIFKNSGTLMDYTYIPSIQSGANISVSTTGSEIYVNTDFSGTFYPVIISGSVSIN